MCKTVSVCGVRLWKCRVVNDRPVSCVCPTVHRYMFRSDPSISNRWSHVLPSVSSVHEDPKEEASHPGAVSNLPSPVWLSKSSSQVIIFAVPGANPISLLHLRFCSQTYPWRKEASPNFNSYSPPRTPPDSIPMPSLHTSNLLSPLPLPSRDTVPARHLVVAPGSCNLP